MRESFSQSSPLSGSWTSTRFFNSDLTCKPLWVYEKWTDPKNIQKSVTQRTKMVTVSKALQHDLRQRDSVLAQQLDTAATCGSWCIMIYLLLSGNRHSRKINCYFQSFLNSCEVQKLQRGATVSSLKTKLDLTNLLINKFNKFTNLS